jgi:hypothetical protein
MKKIILVLAAALLFVCSGTYSQNVSRETAQKADNPVKVNGPVAKFDKTVHEFGDLIQSSPGTAKFVLTNDGNEPLVIASATASCGCTTPSYSKDPILPGKSIDLSVTYNAAVLGNFMKTVTVKTNASDQPIVLKIEGKVVAKP